MREEHVDGGFLVTQGVYTGLEDFNKPIVRQLMIERRIAPFWRGLNDHSDSWTEYQLVAAARGRPIPAADAIPSEDQYGSHPIKDPKSDSSKNVNNLTVPITSRSQSFNSDSSSNPSAVPSPGLPPPGPTLPPATSSSGSALFRGRAKTLASLTTSSKNPQSEMTPREMNLPKDPFVNGQPIEAYLYKDATECPICFLYYPPYLNKTRCCDQTICSECFVQIKRPDPHPPEHGDSAVAVPSDDAEPKDTEDDSALVSEPAACPFCVQPEFGITYEPPSFRRGLTYVNQAPSHPLNNASSAMSSSSSLASAMSGGDRLSPTSISRRRTTSISATSPAVITTDRIRPDWHQKLTGARAHAARRSAAATALHTAAYLMGNRNESDGRGFGAFGRRGILRRASGNDSSIGTGASHVNMLALMSERYAGSSGARGDMTGTPEGEASTIAAPRGSSRRSRMDDLENMMMMEAIRLSLASEEERRKREEKDAKKEAKKKDKENKKAEKVARKAGVYLSSANHSSAGFESPTSESSPVYEDFPSNLGKGKGVQPASPENSSDKSQAVKNFTATAAALPPTDSSADSAHGHLKRARAQLQPGEALTSSIPHISNPYRPSHLRKLSNASSSGSSVGEPAVASLNNDFARSNSSFEASPNSSGVNILPRGSTQNTYISGTPPGGGAGIEPMFNFRSLAAMVGEDEKAESLVQVDQENSGDDRPHYQNRGGESSTSTALGSDMGDSLATIRPGSSKTDEKALDILGEGENGTPGLKITTPTYASLPQGHSNELGDRRSTEEKVEVDTGR